MLALQLFVLILCRQILLHRCFALSCMNLRKYKKWNWFYLPSITSWISLSNLTIIINMNHIQAYASVLSTVELNTRLKEDREKLRVIFRTFKLFPPTPVYVCLYYISGHKWFTTHRVLKSHRSKMGIIYIYNHENNVPSRLSPQWLCGSSWTWTLNVYDAHHVPKCMSCHKTIVVITQMHGTRWIPSPFYILLQAVQSNSRLY